MTHNDRNGRSSQGQRKCGANAGMDKAFKNNESMSVKVRRDTPFQQMIVKFVLISPNPCIHGNATCPWPRPVGFRLNDTYCFFTTDVAAAW